MNAMRNWTAVVRCQKKPDGDVPDRGCAYTGFVDSFFAIYVAAPDTRPARTPMAMRTPQSASRHGSAHTQATAHAAAPRGAAR